MGHLEFQVKCPHCEHKIDTKPLLSIHRKFLISGYAACSECKGTCWVRYNPDIKGVVAYKIDEIPEEYKELMG